MLNELRGTGDGAKSDLLVGGGELLCRPGFSPGDDGLARCRLAGGRTSCTFGESLNPFSLIVLLKYFVLK